MEQELIISLLQTITGGLLTGFSEKAGENLLDKVVNSNTWQKIKADSSDKETQLIETIEAKTIIDAEATAFITQKIKQTPNIAHDMKKLLGITPVNEFIIEMNLETIEELKKDIQNLYKKYYQMYQYIHP